MKKKARFWKLDGTLGPPLALRALSEQFHQESGG